MSKQLNIGVIGLTHDHIWDNLPWLAHAKGARLVAAAEPNDTLRRRVAREYGCAAHADFKTMLKRETLDAVLIYGDNRGGAVAGVEALRRGLHVLIEKPMAADLAGADALLRAAHRAQRRLMINWPIAWWPALQHALAMARDGKIGHVWQTRYRAAHNGPREMGASRFFCDWLYDPQRNGGGALIDYCCYGAALARVVLGRPHSVLAVAGRLCKRDLATEDNAVLLMRYPNALAIAEASWTQVDKMTAYFTVIYGEQGTLLVEPGERGRLLHATPEHPGGRPVRVPRVPEHQRHAVAHFVWALQTGDGFHPLCSAEAGHDAQAILSAGARSAKSGREIKLPS